MHRFGQSPEHESRIALEAGGLKLSKYLAANLNVEVNRTCKYDRKNFKMHDDYFENDASLQVRVELQTDEDH